MGVVDTSAWVEWQIGSATARRMRSYRISTGLPIDGAARRSSRYAVVSRPGIAIGALDALPEQHRAVVHRTLDLDGIDL